LVYPTENDKMVDTDNHYDTEPQMVRAESNVSEHLGHKEYQEKEDYMAEAASYNKEHDEEEDNSPIEEVAAVVPKYELLFKLNIWPSDLISPDH
jgi:hypothetical protein